MRPLSERLQHESEAGWGEDLACLLREAAALAKRYEDAPVGECMEVGNLVDCDGNRFVGAIIESSIPELRKGQPLVYHRVRIMREES